MPIKSIDKVTPITDAQDHHLNDDDVLLQSYLDIVRAVALAMVDE